MSFRRKGPGVIASGAMGALTGLALVAGIVFVLQIPAQAQRSDPAFHGGGVAATGTTTTTRP